jgi:putative membrane-bound dehydrogenase-like protein
MARHWSLVIGHLSFVFAGSLVLGHWSFAAEIANPLSPDESQKAFQLADSSLRIELAAAEPQVVDPVAIRFDEDGRMWVVEMRDYPLGNPTGGEPLSRIRVLEDKDGDGRFETATTFADKLLFVTGLQPWKGGVFVTLSGRLAYMKDTDGDGRADVDETWYTGFAELNTQLRANHPRLALDNWIYVANGLRGGKVVNKKLGEMEPINISGMDFRFHPITGVAEAVTGNGQFGLCFDDWGNRFNCSNRNPVRHVVIEDRYLKANPGVTVPATVNDVAAWGEQSRIFPISRAWTTSNLHAGQFTAACGVYIYRGDLLPAEFKGNVFTCDPTGNLIHREIMQPAGPTFTSKAAYEGKEFLASPDEWFRPVNMELGPDGALYVVDMYRCVIEHPDFVPDELKRRPDLRLGDDRGRIWRIVPAEGSGFRVQRSAESDNTNPKRKRGIDTPPLSKVESGNLVSLLEHANAWQRETAQRLLLEREWRPSDDRLVELATDGATPQGRVHALSLLRSMGMTTSEQLETLFSDRHPQVRRLALFAATSHPTAASTFAFKARTLLADESGEVRFAAKLCMRTIDRGFIDGPLDGYFAEAIKDVNDPWQRIGIRMSLDARTALNFTNFPFRRGGQPVDDTPGLRLLLRDLREQAVVNAEQAVEHLNDLLSRTQGVPQGAKVPQPAEYANAAALLDAATIRTNPGLGVAALLGGLKGLARRRAVPHDTGAASIEEIRREVAAIVSASNDADLRREAIEALSFLPDAVDYLVPLIARNEPQPIRLAGIAALTRQRGDEGWHALLDGFASDTPPVRRAIIDALLGNRERTILLLNAIEAGQIKVSEIDAAQIKRLVENRDAAIKERAGKILAAAMPADRAKALAEYQPVLAMKGDPKNGQVVFEKNCAACHRIAGIGVNVAPDISDSRTKKPEQLLADILQPNRAIDNNYLGYTVRQLDGTVLTGILAAETATSITLRQQGGKEAVIARSEIEELRSTGQSLMPEGLERNIPPQDMADLISFIKNWRYLDGRTPLAE